MPNVDIEAIREAVRRNQYLLSLHVRRRKGERKVTDEEIKTVIVEGEVIEEYPKAKP